MTKFQTYLIAILSAGVACVIYKFVPDLRELAAPFVTIAGGLIGWTIQHPADAPKPPVQVEPPKDAP